jgi:hypothetical protein
VVRVGEERVVDGDPIGAGSLGRLEALTELKTAWHPVGT